MFLAVLVVGRASLRCTVQQREAFHLNLQLLHEGLPRKLGPEIP